MFAILKQYLTSLPLKKKPMIKVLKKISAYAKKFMLYSNFNLFPPLLTHRPNSLAAGNVAVYVTWS